MDSRSRRVGPRCPRSCHLMADTGVSHNRSGANYRGTCTVCQKRYRGETGFNAYPRLDSV